MEFLELAKKRYSVRQYLDKPVEEEKLQKVLEVGRVAPTGANRQPQRILVVQSKEARAKVDEAARLYGAPVVLVICAQVDEAWVRKYDGKNIADIDAAIVTDHMMLEATQQGLGSLWVCWFKPDVLRQALDIPEGWEPVNLLALGYADGEPASPERHATLRKPLEETVWYK